MLTAMIPILLSLVMTVSGAYGPARALQDGTLLRLHIIAQDDTDAMQRIKYPVRDAVQTVYARQADDACSMLENARLLLPQLEDAALCAARTAGFNGSVTVSLDLADFDTRSLEGVIIPAGRYPALIIRLGDGLGHNWWGLLDPDRSLLAACCGQADTALVWDWSPQAWWQGILYGLGRWFGGAA